MRPVAGVAVPGAMAAGLSAFPVLARQRALAEVSETKQGLLDLFPLPGQGREGRGSTHRIHLTMKNIIRYCARTSAGWQSTRKSQKSDVHPPRDSDLVKSRLCGILRA